MKLTDIGLCVLVPPRLKFPAQEKQARNKGSDDVTRSATKVVLTRYVSRMHESSCEIKLTNFSDENAKSFMYILVEKIVPTKGEAGDGDILRATGSTFFFHEAYFNHLRTFRVRPDRDLISS